MAVARPKHIVQQRVTGACPTHSRTDISVRDVASVIDEPRERDGTNAGPTPTETMIASLIGCTNVISHKIAHKYGVDFESMSVTAEASFDRRGAMLEREIDLPFPKVVLNIEVTTSASDDELAKVRQELPMYCPVSKVFRAAGAEVEEVWTVNRR